MPLLNNTAPQEQSQAPEEMPENETPESSGPFDSATIEESIMQQLEQKQAQDVTRVVEAGTKILFSKEGGFDLFSQIRPEDEVPLADELGAAAVNFMMILVDKSGNSMPGEAIGPAGIILLARASEFINTNGIDEVTYDIFSDAVKLFSEVIASKFEGGEESPEQPIPEEQPMPQPAQQGGLLNQGVA